MRCTGDDGEAEEARDGRCMLGCTSRDGARARVQVEKVEMRMAQVGPCICYRWGRTMSPVTVYERHTHWEWYLRY